MGYVFGFNDANAYEQWFQNPHNRFVADLETRLILDMLKPVKGETLLDIGCGTGAFFTPFLEKGLAVTGIDPSPYMIDIAAKKIGNRVDLHRGFAEELPFEDNSFNLACLILTLEFTDDPHKALQEACRVTKDRIFLGILNRYSFNRARIKIKGLFKQTLYSHARFFSIWELNRNIRAILGHVPKSWRTVSLLPRATGRITQRLELSPLVQMCPFGAFAGMVVTLIPRFRTTPLGVSLPKQTGSAAMG